MFYFFLDLLRRKMRENVKEVEAEAEAEAEVLIQKK
jgi:hypothetical protein